MLIVSLKSQLANQMFAYASIKSICMDKGYDFRYFNEYCSEMESANSHEDKKYGRNVDTIFKIPACEKVDSIPTSFKIHEEAKYTKIHKCNYYKEIYDVEDNTYMDGHFISPKYFEHRIDQVREWFAFPDDIKHKVEKQIDALKVKYPGEQIVSVHFRVGDDYRNMAYLLSSTYQHRAAKLYKEMESRPVRFVVFYDKMTVAVKRFIKKYKAESMHGSLVEDLCGMSLCDGNIVANSSFSIMGALLNTSENGKVIRPSIYPTGIKKFQNGSFRNEWIVADAKQSLYGIFFAKTKIGNISYKLKYKILRNLCR